MLESLTILVTLLFILSVWNSVCITRLEKRLDARVSVNPQQIPITLASPNNQGIFIPPSDHAKRMESMANAVALGKRGVTGATS